jgi:flagellar hook-associated protein 1 FlgK
MSLAAAFNAATSGLAVTARRSEVVSNNVANATTDGYARRSLTTGPAMAGSGVRAIGTERHVDTVMLAETRLARASASGSDYLARQILRLETAFASAGSDNGLMAAIDRLDAAFISAGGEPSSPTRLAELSDALRGIATGFATATERVQALRAEADAKIAADVDMLNTALVTVSTLDRRITQWEATGRDVAALRDQRQAAIDAVSAIVPLREVTGTDGRTRLVTAEGAVLLDGKPATLTFARSPTLTATGPVANQLFLDGYPVPGAAGQLSGGTLGAAFTIRDRIGPETQAMLDDIARTIAQRLETGDATLAPGDAGLLTDRGAPIDPTATTGIAARLTLNAAADPAAGGDLWRFRSGLGAAMPGPVGESETLTALQAALSQDPGSPRTMAARLAETINSQRVRTEDGATAAAARAETFANQLAEGGVDTDAEMQDLIQIEQTYAANAKVLQAIRDMLDFLLMR